MRDGGGIFADAEIVRLRNSIVALNTALGIGPDLQPRGLGAGGFDSDGYNLIGKNESAESDFPAGNPNANNDIVGTSASAVDPLLDPTGLQNNGGPTPTIALLTGSPAIDKGSSSTGFELLTTDQRGFGFARARDNVVIANAAGGDGTDIGAFEFNGLLRLTSIVRNGDNIAVSFAGVEGFTYRLELKLGITFEYWESIAGVADVTMGNSGSAQVTDPGVVSLEKGILSRAPAAVGRRREALPRVMDMRKPTQAG